MAVRKTISDLIKLKEHNSSHLDGIKDFNKLIHSLNELDSMVEMNSAKDIVCKQISFIIVEKNRPKNNMLNAIITGKPGVGKTKLACILAKIWDSMGLIGNNKENNTDISKQIPILVSNHIFESHISDLKNKLDSAKSGFAKIKNYIAASDTPINNFESQLNKLKRSHRFTNYRQEIALFENLDEIKSKISEVSSITDQFTDQSYSNIDIPDARANNIVTYDDSYVSVVSREDFVAGYVGQTAPKTKSLLDKNRGKVLFIDEAYSLFNGTANSNDNFGMEAITTLNEFLSSNPNEIIVIFAGYKEQMNESIFKKQPGLKRRCMWTFDIDDYTPEGLSKIFTYQLAQDNWSLLSSDIINCSFPSSEHINIVRFFQQKYSNFPNFGGDTEKFIYHCKLAYTQIKYQHILNSINSPSDPKDDSYDDHIITKTMFDIAFKTYLEHQSTDTPENTDWTNIYR